MAKDLTTLRGIVWKTTGSTEKRLPTSEIDDIVNNVIADISRMADISFDQRTLSVGIDYGSNSTDQFRNARVVHSVSVNGSTLAYLVPDDFFPYTEGNLSGDPQCWTLWGNDMVFYPVPETYSGQTGTAFTAEVRYVSEPDTVTITNPTRYLENAWDVILPGVQAEACTSLLEDRRKPIFDAKFSKRLRRFLIMQSRIKNAAHRIESRDQV